MIEAKYIRELCDRFEAYLTPLCIKILRLRYNGQELLLPNAVGQKLGISDERVRQLEERALGDLADCLDLEAHDQEITPIRLAKSFKQPVATLICQGRWRSCSVPAYTAQRGELLIHAPITLWASANSRGTSGPRSPRRNT
jgi:Sigma-70, region 4